MDDRALSAVTAGWTRKTGTHYYRHTFTTTATTGAKLKLAAARLHRLALVVTRCPTCGSLDITVNGVHHSVSTAAASTHYRALIFLPAIRTQTATIVIRTTSNHRVFIDGLAIIRT